MNEGDPGERTAPGGGTGAMSVGATLRAGREAQGLSLDDISQRTRVPLRHLEAIESGDYQSLPASTYAVGFSRAYARALGMDDVPIAAAVRNEVNRQGPRPREYQPYEVADPARVPPRGVAILGLGLALALAILAALYFASRWSSGGGDAPAEPSAANAVVASVPAAPAASPTPVSGGQVTLTANDEVWLRVYDADDKTLFIGTMQPGQRFDVPAGARDPKINVGRPDKLQVTLNGSAAPPLGDGARPIKDVRVSAEAIAARISGAPVPTASPSAAATPLASAEPIRAAPAPAARPRRVLTETQRANLASAAAIRAQQRR